MISSPSSGRRSGVNRSARHDILSRIVLVTLLMVAAGRATEARADGDRTGSLLMFVSAPASAPLVIEAAEPDLLDAGPARPRRLVRAPNLPAVRVTGYNLSLLGRVRGDFAAKLTLGVEKDEEHVRTGVIPALGMGIEYSF